MTSSSKTSAPAQRLVDACSRRRSGRRAGRAGTSAPRRPPASKKSCIRYLPDRADVGQHRDVAGELVEAVAATASTPARPAIAIRWMTALVEPPSASTTVIAFSKDSSVSGDAGKRDDAAARRDRHARVVASPRPGSTPRPAASRPAPRPRTSSSTRCPSSCSGRAIEAIRSSTASQSASRDRSRRAARPSTSTRRSRSPASRRASAPAASGPHGTKMNGSPRRDRAHDQRGRRLVAPAQQHRAVERIRPQQLLGLHRQQVPVEHRRRLHERLAQRDRRHLQREPARLPDAALDVLARDRAGACGTG